MAINQITQPGSGTPTTNTDYTNQNLLINGSFTLPNGNIMTDWALTASAPAVAQHTYIRHANNLYQVQTSDETITGSPSAGVNYLKLSVSGSTLTAAWVTTFAGYTYNAEYNGWYSGTDQIIFNGDYLDGAAHRRYLSPNNMPYQYVVADGRLLVDNKNIYTNGADVITSGGDVSTLGGNVNTTAGSVNTTGGAVNTGGGNVNSAGGTIDSGDGDIDSGTGDITGSGQHRLFSNNTPLSGSATPATGAGSYTGFGSGYVTPKHTDLAEYSKYNIWLGVPSAPGSANLGEPEAGRVYPSFGTTLYLERLGATTGTLNYWYV